MARPGTGQLQQGTLGAQCAAGPAAQGLPSQQGPSWASMSSECSSPAVGSGVYTMSQRTPSPGTPPGSNGYLSSLGTGAFGGNPLPTGVVRGVPQPSVAADTVILPARTLPVPVVTSPLKVNIVSASPATDAAVPKSFGWPMSIPAQSEQMGQERSQSSAPAGEAPPEKNTFIHYPVPGSLTSSMTRHHPEWVSAPDMLITQPFETKHPSMEERHRRGDCKPCAYFLYKVDGCRHGDQCEYCHLCRRGEIKKRKKEKVRALRAEEAAAEDAAAAEAGAAACAAEQDGSTPNQ